MKLLSLAISFFAYSLDLSAQDIHSTFGTKDIAVTNPSVAGKAYSYREQQAENTTPIEVSVTYKSFQVERLRTKVDLVWETTAEIHNSGFEIQRRTNGGEWQKVAFVFSQAADGNSNRLLTYDYTDVNIIKGESEYRLKQLNINKLTSFSETRSIGGY